MHKKHAHILLDTWRPILTANLIKTSNRVRCRQNRVFAQSKNFTLTYSAAR